MERTAIEKIIEQEFESCKVEVNEIEEGLKHPTYRISADGETYILQVSDKIGEGENELDRSVKSYDLLQDTRIPVPNLRTGLDKISVDEQELKYYIVESSGDKSLGGRVSKQMTSDAGKILGRIHSYQSFDEAGWLLPEENGFSVVSFPEGSYKEHINNNWQDYINTLAEKEDWKDVAEQAQNFFDKYSDDLPKDFEPVFCHDDYSPDNLMVEDSEISAVIDFDMAYAGHSYRDLAKAANSFWMHDPCADWNIRKTLYESYNQKMKLGDEFEKFEPIYRVETIIGTVTSLIELNHFTQEEEDFYRKQIPEIIEKAEQDLE